jgi:hypothetical protein
MSWQADMSFETGGFEHLLSALLDELFFGEFFDIGVGV